MSSTNPPLNLKSANLFYPQTQNLISPRYQYVDDSVEELSPTNPLQFSLAANSRTPTLMCQSVDWSSILSKLEDQLQVERIKNRAFENQLEENKIRLSKFYDLEAECYNYKQIADGLRIQLADAQSQASQNHKATYDEIAKSILAPNRKEQQLEATIIELRKELAIAYDENKATKEVFDRRERKFQDKVDELVNFNDSLQREIGNLTAQLQGNETYVQSFLESTGNTFLEDDATLLSENARLCSKLNVDLTEKVVTQKQTANQILKENQLLWDEIKEINSLKTTIIDENLDLKRQVYQLQEEKNALIYNLEEVHESYEAQKDQGNSNSIDNLHIDFQRINEQLRQQLLTERQENSQLKKKFDEKGKNGVDYEVFQTKIELLEAKLAEAKQSEADSRKENISRQRTPDKENIKSAREQHRRSSPLLRELPLNEYARIKNRLLGGPVTKLESIGESPIHVEEQFYDIEVKPSSLFDSVDNKSNTSIDNFKLPKPKYKPVKSTEPSLRKRPVSRGSNKRKKIIKRK